MCRPIMHGRFHGLVSTSVRLSLLASLVAATIADAQTLPAERGKPPDTAAAQVLQFDLYVRPDSPLCDQATEAARKFCKARGGVELNVLDVVADRSALAKYWELMKQYGVQKPVLPVFYACQQLKVGFADDEGDARFAELFTIHAYVRQGCQHCRDATTFLNGLARRWPGVRIVFHDLASDSRARQEMSDVARRHGVSAIALPGIVLCGHYIAGYQTDATTGREIERLLRNSSVRSTAKRQSLKVGVNAEDFPSFVPMRPEFRVTVPMIAVAAVIADDEPPPAPDALPLPEEGPPPLPSAGSTTDDDLIALPKPARDSVDLPWFGRIYVSDLGLPLFTIAIGLIDGFNPCAMWVLVFLLSVLANVKDRRKIAAIAGTFVLVSGVVYFAFMAAWLNLFMLIDLARPLQIGVGLLAVVIGLINVKDFFAFKRGITLSIPESVKPGIYERVRRIVGAKYLSVAIGASVVLALFVNIVELLCTAGLPAVYTQILSQQQLPIWKNYAYIALYNLAYMFDDGLMVGTFLVTLSHRKMREDEGRWLKLISGGVVLALGFTVLFKPEWLQWGGS